MQQHGDDFLTDALGHICLTREGRKYVGISFAMSTSEQELTRRTRRPSQCQVFVQIVASLLWHTFNGCFR